jgi:signal transduction histidine kinase
MKLSTPASPPPSLAERIDRQQLELVVAAVRRTPVALLLMNLFAAWLVWRAGWPRLAVAWFLVYCLMHALRWSWVRRWHDHPPADPRQALRRLSLIFVVLGAMLALMALLVFASDVAALHYTATALCVGVSAGAVVVSAWTPRVFAAWGLMVGGALVAGWIWHGQALGLGLAVLVVALFWVLFSQSRDQQQALEQLVRLAAENERLVASLRGERDRAEAASQSKTRFFAAASHDLRQPLHALSINAYALAVLARRHGDAKILQLSDSIDRALRQSTSLLDGLLDVSRLDAGAVQPEIRDVDAASLLEGVRHEFAPLAAQRGLTLALELPPQPRLALRTDPDLLLRVLNNLIGNALKFTREGGVRISAAPDGASHVRLAVVDTGCGIAQDEQERVFEEFYQVANPSRDRSQGLGLGLAIVRRVASLLDIDVRLDSAPGRGTRVELRVPAAAAPLAPAAAADDAPPLPGLKVLVIDDEPEVRASMLALVGALQGEGRAAEGRDDAVALVNSGFAPDVIVVDHRLRDQSGLDAVAAVRAAIGPRPVVVVTGDTAPQTLAQVQGSGYRVVHKPVDGASLARALRDAAAG